MKSIKTADLTGPALDWAVAKCEGYTDLRWNHENSLERFLLMTPPRVAYGPVFLWELGYSTDWSEAGPIIEREGLTIALDACRWEARHYDGESEPWVFVGPTPLIAAMRCYVASKLGDVVDVPNELI